MIIGWNVSQLSETLTRWLNNVEGSLAKKKVLKTRTLSKKGITVGVFLHRRNMRGLWPLAVVVYLLVGPRWLPTSLRPTTWHPHLCRVAGLMLLSTRTPELHHAALTT